MEKCFCHLIDRITGEIYVVKDKEARSRITDIEADTKNIPAMQAELANHKTRIDTVAERCTRIDGQLTSLSEAVNTNISRHWEQDAAIRANTQKNSAQEIEIANLRTRVTAIENGGLTEEAINAKIREYCEAAFGVYDHQLYSLEQEIDTLKSRVNALEGVS